MSKKRFTMVNAQQVSLQYQTNITEVCSLFSPKDIIGVGIGWDENTELPFINIIFNKERKNQIDVSHIPPVIHQDGNKIDVRTEFRTIATM